MDRQPYQMMLNIFKSTVMTWLSKKWIKSWNKLIKDSILRTKKSVALNIAFFLSYLVSQHKNNVKTKLRQCQSSICEMFNTTFKLFGLIKWIWFMPIQIHGIFKIQTCMTNLWMNPEYFWIILECLNYWTTFIILIVEIL